jgi:hypothetical protein
VSFVAITLSVASQRVTPKVSVYFVIDSDRKLLDIPSYISLHYIDDFTSTVDNIKYELMSIILPKWMLSSDI